jgi:hypothetical protein
MEEQRLAEADLLEEEQFMHCSSTMAALEQDMLDMDQSEIEAMESED